MRKDDVILNVLKYQIQTVHWGKQNTNLPAKWNSYWKKSYTFFEFKRQYEERKELQLDPDYQRKLVWKPKQKSELNWINFNENSHSCFLFL